MCFFSARWRERDGGLQQGAQKRHHRRVCGGRGAADAHAVPGARDRSAAVRGGAARLRQPVGPAAGLAGVRGVGGRTFSAPAGVKGRRIAARGTKAASSACMRRARGRTRRARFPRRRAFSAPAGVSGTEDCSTGHKSGIIGVYAACAGEDAPRVLCAAAAVGHLICARTIGCGMCFFSARWREGGRSARQHRRVCGVRGG